MTDCEHVFQEVLSKNLCAQDDQAVRLAANEVPSSSVPAENHTSSEIDRSVLTQTLSRFFWQRYPHKLPKDPLSLDYSMPTTLPKYPKESEIRTEASSWFRGPGWSLTHRRSDRLKRQSDGKAGIERREAIGSPT